MYDRKILPFYMTYPLPMFYQEEDSVIRDLEYLQQMYPTEAKKYQKLISEILDKLDYEGSLIYDEYPDRWQLYKLSMDILDRLKREEIKERRTKAGMNSPEEATLGSKDISKNIGIDSLGNEEKWEWIGDLVQILLFYEIYKRRHNSRRGFLKF